jgi:hypothetical protein
VNYNCDHSPAIGPEAPKPIVARSWPVRAAGVKIRKPLATSKALCPRWAVIHSRTTAGTFVMLNRNTGFFGMPLAACRTTCRLNVLIQYSIWGKLRVDDTIKEPESVELFEHARILNPEAEIHQLAPRECGDVYST